MEVGSLDRGSAPPPPPLLVGRADDLRKLTDLLTRQLRAEVGRSVRLTGELLRAARAKRSMTQEALSMRAGLSSRVIKKAEAGEPIRRSTAELISQVFGRLDEFIAPEGEATTMQTLIAVHGWPGVGKTTLARKIAHDEEIKRAFPDGVLWASLGQSPNLLAEIVAWSHAIGDNDIGWQTGADDERRLQHARLRLGALLMEKRMLLIIDDVWEPEHALSLSLGGMKCSILVTTRLTEVADAVAPSDEDVYRLDVLSDEAAEKLLEKLAPNVLAKHRQETRELARELERLPLALQVAGSLLRIEERNGFGVVELLEELRYATRLLREKPPTDVYTSAAPSIAAMLRKSTDVLDNRARKCFAYLAPYAPKPATFDLAALESQWITISVDSKEMAQSLIERGLLEPIGSGHFWMHAMLVAHANSLLENQDRPSQGKKANVTV